MKTRFRHPLGRVVEIRPVVRAKTNSELIDEALDEMESLARKVKTYTRRYGSPNINDLPKELVEIRDRFVALSAKVEALKMARITF